MHNSQSPCNKIEILINKKVLIRIQHDFPFNNNDLVKLNSIYVNSLIYLHHTLNKILSLKESLPRESQAQLSAEVQKEYQYELDKIKIHFNIKSDDNTENLVINLQKLYDKLLKIWDGLYAEESKLYLSNVSKKYLKFWKTDSGYIHPDNPNVIYLNMRYLDSDPDILTNTLIHEASHLFAGTNDYNIYYPPANSNLNKIENEFFGRLTCRHLALTRMSVSQRINHADSLCNFICELGYHEKINKNGINIQFPERDLISININQLFSTKNHFGRMNIATLFLNQISKSRSVKN